MKINELQRLSKIIEKKVYQGIANLKKGCKFATSNQLKHTTMTLNELPQEVQDKLNEMRSHLYKDEHRNDAYNVILVNKEGTRYFFAKRVCESWNDDKGHYMPFGGGTHWNIKYGPIMWTKRSNPVGQWDYEWCVPSPKHYTKSMNGTEIPSLVSTKKEVLSIAKAIGIFEL